MAFPKKTPNGGKGVKVPQNAHLGDAASGHARPGAAGKWHKTSAMTKGKKGC
jgi:hypothetical protein